MGALWKEVAILRNKHASQQKIVNKLIQFLVTMVQPGAAARMTATGAVSPAVAASIKRKFVSPLAIEDDSGPSSSKEPRLSAFSDQITVQDVTHEMLPPSSSTSVPTVQMVSSPAATSTIAVTPVVSRSSNSSAVTPS